MNVSTFWRSEYGFRTKSIARLSNDLAAILQIEWQIRDSESLGEYYLYPAFQSGQRNSQQESIWLYLNRASWLEGWKNRDFKQFYVLMTTTRSNPLEIDALLFLKLNKNVALLNRHIMET
jgi:hypothetical protein